MDQDLQLLNADQQRGCLEASLTVLRFLVEPSKRRLWGISQGDMASFSDSAIFHRLHDLLWTLRDRPVVALLNTEEKTALAEFNEAYGGLPWREIEGHAHIRDLADDDLSPLVPTGKRLFDLLEAHIRASYPEP